MKWTLEDGSSGVVTFSNDSSYWLSAPVLLKQGDNRITVHATGKRAMVKLRLPFLM